MASPTVVRRYTAVSSTTNATSWTPSWTRTLNTAISAGGVVRWYAFVTSDGNPTLTTSSAGWTKVGQTSDATLAVTQALFWCETYGAYAASAEPALVISSAAASEQFSAVVIAELAGSGKRLEHVVGTPSTGSSTNSNPGSITNSSGASQDFDVIASRGGDSTVVATVAPTNYSNLLTATGGGTNGASTNTAQRQITIANGVSEDPGTFTSATEQWVCYTVGVYEVAGKSAASTLQDNFDDNSLDGAKWTTGGYRVAGDVTTGVTVSETGGLTQITGPVSTVGGSFSGRISASLLHLIDSEIVIKLLNSSMADGAEDVYLSFGEDANNHYAVLVRRASTNFYLLLGYVLAGSFVQIGSTVDLGTTLPSWYRLRYATSDNSIKADTAASGASDPPISGDWTNRATATHAVPLSLSAGYAAFGAGTWASTATPTTFQLDGFNAATTSSTNRTATASITPGNFTATATALIRVKAAASVTPSNFLSTAASKALIEGLGSGTLNAFTTTGVAKARVKATAGPSLNSLTSTAVAKARVKATAAASPSNFTAAATGLVRVKAVGSATPNAFVSSAAAKALIEGQGAGTLTAFGATSIVKVRIKAAASITLGNFSLTSTANAIIEAAASATFGNFTSSSASTVRVKAAASPALSVFISAAAAKALVEGAGSGNLNAFEGAAATKVRVKASASSTLDSFTATSAGLVYWQHVIGSASVALDAFTTTAAAKVFVEAAAAPAINTFLSSAASRVLVEGVGSGTLNAFVTASVAKARLSAAGNATLGSFTGAAMALVRVKTTTSATLSPFISASAASVLVEGAGSGLLSGFTTDSAGKVRVKAAAAASVGSFTAAATIGSSTVHLSGSPSLGTFSTTAAARVKVVGSVDVEINPFGSAATVGEISETPPLHIGGWSPAYLPERKKRRANARFVIVEGADSAAFEGSVSVVGKIAIAEAADRLRFEGVLSALGRFTAIESDDGWLTNDWAEYDNAFLLAA